jgi:hypothetical protein
VIPSVRSSPWILRYPHKLFSCASRNTRARMERTVGGPADSAGSGDGRVSASDQVAVPPQHGLWPDQQP